jgi:hypothetical protein
MMAARTKESWRKKEEKMNIQQSNEAAINVTQKR